MPYRIGSQTVTLDEYVAYMVNTQERDEPGTGIHRYEVVDRFSGAPFHIVGHSEIEAEADEACADLRRRRAVQVQLGVVR